MADIKKNQDNSIGAAKEFFVDTDTRPLEKVKDSKFNLKFLKVFRRFFKRRKNVDDFINNDMISTELIEVEKNELAPDDLNCVHKEYDFIYKFAEGGQGVMYSAIDKVLGRLVAIKTLRKEYAADDSARKNFVAEAKITAQLDHPGIVPVYSLNIDDSKNFYMAMKMVHGQSLDEYLNKIIQNYNNEGIDRFDEEKSLRNRLEIILHVCDALAYAHSKNIMHCDLKGENIMIGEFHEVFVMDWGFARFIKERDFDEKNWTRPEKLIGTPGYLSPEAVNGEYTDQRADIFSIGAVLFKTVFLKKAFEGETADEIMRKIHSNKVSSFKHKFGFRVGRDLKAIVRKALAHNRKHRYQKISDLADDIRRYLNCHAVSAATDNLFRKFVRWSRRHTAFLIVVIILALFTAMVSVGYNFFIQHFVMPHQHQLENRELIGLVSSLRKLENSNHTIHNLGNSMQQIANMTTVLKFDKVIEGDRKEARFGRLEKIIDAVFQQNELLLGIELTLNDGTVFSYCRHNCREDDERIERDVRKPADKIIFSVPHYDEHIKKFVNYLDIPIKDENNQVIGVLTSIIDLSKVQQDFADDEVSLSIVDIYWINGAGKIIFKHSNNYNDPSLQTRVSADYKQLSEDFEDRIVGAKIKQQKYGLEFANGDNASQILYSFIYFEDLDLYYVEKINLAELENFKFNLRDNYWEIIKSFYKQCFNRR